MGSKSLALICYQVAATVYVIMLWRHLYHACILYKYKSIKAIITLQFPVPAEAPFLLLTTQPSVGTLPHASLTLWRALPLSLFISSYIYTTPHTYIYIYKCTYALLEVPKCAVCLHSLRFTSRPHLSSYKDRYSPATVFILSVW